MTVVKSRLKNELDDKDTLKDRNVRFKLKNKNLEARIQELEKQLQGPVL